MRVRMEAGLSVLVVAVLGAGCSEQAPAAKAGPPQVTATAAATSVTSAGAEIGVPECDRYVKDHQACLDTKVPEAARAMMRQSFDQTRAAWKQAASTPEGRQGLAMGCAQAEAMARQAMAAYGCKW